MIPRPRLIAALFLAPLALSMGGCGTRDNSDLEAYIRQILARPPKPIEPLPELKPVETFVFEPDNRRDPFVSDVRSEPEPSQLVEEEVDELAPDPNRPKEPLEAYALDALRMVGTLEQNDSRWGLVRTQDGLLHRVQVGNYMGLNHGLIVRIDDTAIELTEVVLDPSGKWRDRTATLALTE